MPSTSKAQQRLMGMAYALKIGEMDPKDASQEVKDLAAGMTKQQLHDFAATKHKGLPDYVEEDATGLSTPSNTPGMGNVSVPGNPGTSTSFTGQKVGSGDIPMPSKKKKKMKLVESFDEFISENYEVEQLEDIATKLGKAYSCDFKVEEKGAFGPTLSYQPWEVALVSGGSGWNMGRYFNKKDADEVAKYVNANEVRCLTGASLAKVEKNQMKSYLSGEDLTGLMKAAGIKI
jgi:hypothetical protein